MNLYDCRSVDSNLRDYQEMYGLPITSTYYCLGYVFICTVKKLTRTSLLQAVFH